MSRRPVGKEVPCPRCDETAYAIVPENSEIVETEDEADSKTWVTCRDCGERFIVHFRRTGNAT